MRYKARKEVYNKWRGVEQQRHEYEGKDGGAEGKSAEAQEGGRGQKRGRSEEQETRGAWVAKVMRQAGTAAGGMARAAARAVWTMFGALLGY
mgnify:CR=1 FL=1